MRQSFNEKLIEIRRDLHRHPESGWMEYYTTARIIHILKEENISVQYGKSLHALSHMYGMPSDEVMQNAWHRASQMIDDPDLMTAMKGGFTGCVAEISGRLPGKTTVIRVDIDACDLEECHDAVHRPARLGFDSMHQGQMHACGHDAHTAIGIGAAMLIQKKIELLRGTVRIIFQPAEEGLRGAASMVQAGVLSDCDRLIGFHVGLHDLPIGTVAAACTDFLSSTKLDAVFYGKAAHAGLCPELGKNALAAAATATLDLLDLPDRFDGLNRVNVGSLHAESGRNIIPARASLTLETRADTPERNKQLQAAAESILHTAAEKYGCTFIKKYMGGSNAAACNTELSHRIQRIMEDMPAIKNILPSIPFGGGEDVTTMMQFVQDRGGSATELLLGMPLTAPHHSDHFDIDEDIIPLGAELLARIALSLD